MKSILLSSAAVFAFAGAAAAEVTLSGEAELGYNTSPRAGFAEDEYEGFYTDLSVELTLSQTLDTPGPLARSVEDEHGAARVLTGTARLDRLALDVGTGEWADTEWIGQYVDVAVRVEAEVGTD